jgi:hypothetical protein
MDDPRTGHQCQFRVERQECILERMSGIARAGVNNEARGLVDHEESPVLEYDIERQILSFDGAIGLHARFDHDFLTAKHFVASAQMPSVHLHGTRFYPSLQACP